MKKSITISLCMIVKNEEQTISRCLESVKDIVNEIIIIDTGSTDKTKEIVKKYNAKIYNFKWIDDFSAARNFAFSKATKKYILWLDADDIIEQKDQKEILHLKSTLDTKIDAVSMKYNLTFDTEGNPTFSVKRYRLVKRNKNFQWYGFVHEYLEVYGNLIDSDISITHKKEKIYTDRNLKLYQKHLASGKKFSPRDTYYYANECKDHQLYEIAIEWYTKFLDEKKGWIEDNIQACLKRTECYLKLSNTEGALYSSLQSFIYDNPRGEICCQLGSIFLEKNEYDKAIYWYHTALKISKPTNAPFLKEPCYTWLPHLQLCICYYRINNNEKSIYHNEQAAKFVPNHPSVKYNIDYFNNLK
ncbi:glycosyltransferase family 2 protein [Bacillus sp. CDB3]|uniref:tetratricopeptide repeat-containing glycosyltransferase family 2 protein n=1 Tax=Bacillus sp. CDB3 TaxID=360310 RepID=UPI0009D84886|nr:glycosyltransferase family 2 protein [Bacillus sp. CDB3]OQR53164.1 glycosyl transferase [Bacillus sp. CDB3]